MKSVKIPINNYLLYNITLMSISNSVKPVNFIQFSVRNSVYYSVRESVWVSVCVPVMGSVSDKYEICYETY